MDTLKTLPLSQRKFDYFFIVMFCFFFITSMIADIPTIYGHIDGTSDNILMKLNYNYANGCDPLFLNPPFWMRIITGLSTFVYGPFYLVLVYALIRGKNQIQVPAVVYATAIFFLTGIVVFGVELFGEPQWRCQNLAKFLPYNLPYAIVPLILLIRMRKENPFMRKF
jgi:hypothetical protein